MLELQRVSKSFDRPLFHELSLTIGRGDRLALTGPSGCGKTTLLGILLGIVKPDGGAVRRDGPLHLSAVFQEDRLIEHLSGLDNISALHRRTIDRQTAAAALCALGIDPIEQDKPVSEWSGGMRRRCAIARALLHKGDLVALDEPFTGLDAESKARAIVFIRERLGGTALVLVTHDRADAAALGCREVPLNGRPEQEAAKEPPADDA